MMSEKIELLGAKLYSDIPKELTLKPFPSVTELDYVGSEDFEETMLNSIFPQCIEEKDINFHHLLEIDFQWITRCLRFLNYGPYFTTNAIICDNCGPVRMECQVDLRTIECKPLPENFNGDIVIKKADLIDYPGDIHLHLLTIQESLDLRKDKLFTRPNGDINRELARICYSINSMGSEKQMTPVTARIEIMNKMTPADYRVLRSQVGDITDYGLRGGGKCRCPKCQSDSAAFIALADDRFFRPTVGDLRKGRDDRSLRGIQISKGDKAEAV